MDIKGSCHCGLVTFGCKSHTPYPYMKCYCSICRKTAGGGGYAINIMAQADSLVVEGKENVKVYRANKNREDRNLPEELSTNHRHFCTFCGSYLWAADPSYPQWIYPFASAIDTSLPKPDVTNHIMLGSKVGWVDVPGWKGEDRKAVQIDVRVRGEGEIAEKGGEKEKEKEKWVLFKEYPDLSIEEMHKREGWWVE